MLGQPHGVVQCRRLGDPYRVVIDGQSRGSLERQRAAAGTRRHDDGLSLAQLAGNGLAERLRAVRGPNHVDQFRVLQRVIDVMAGVSDVGETRDIAFGLDAAQMRSAVITAAMSPGVNAYLFANMYGAARRVAASSVLVATAVSILTTWMWIAVLP